MRRDEPVLVAEVVRRDLRHVAVHALLRLGRVVEGSRPEAGDAARLPVVVVVEATDPPVVVHRHVEVDLVAGGAELRRILLHERLQERAAVRLGVHLHEKVVEETHHRLRAGGQVRQLRVLHREAALAHGPVHVHDGVTRDAPEPDLPFRKEHDVPDRAVHQPAEHQRRVVAAAAPLRGLDAVDVLHVLDRLPVPLVVERRKVVRGAVPLLVDVGVAALAGLRVHEEAGLDVRAVGRPDG